MAHCSSFAKAQWDPGENKLKLMGHIIGTIRAILPLPMDSSRNAVREFVKNLSAQDGSFRQFLNTGSGLEALFRTLCLDDFANCYGPVDRGQPSLLDVVRVLAGMLRVPSHEIDEDYCSKESYRWFWGKLNHSCWGRSLVVLEDGTLGMAPASSMPGDHASVLLGCNSAMTLRSVENGSFQAIGSAYIDGFMQGEALFGSLPAHIKPVLKIDLAKGVSYRAFKDEENGDILSEDPRLGPLPLGWKRLNKALAGFWPCFENKDTVEIRPFDQDPRCNLGNLVARSVELQALELV